MYIIITEQNLVIWALLMSKILLQELIVLGRRKVLSEEDCHLKY